MIRKNWATIRTEGKARVAEKEFSIFFARVFMDLPLCILSTKTDWHCVQNVKFSILFFFAFLLLSPELCEAPNCHKFNKKKWDGDSFNSNFWSKCKIFSLNQIDFRFYCFARKFLSIRIDSISAEFSTSQIVKATDIRAYLV